MLLQRLYDLIYRPVKFFYNVAAQAGFALSFGKRRQARAMDSACREVQEQRSIVIALEMVIDNLYSPLRKHLVDSSDVPVRCLRYVDVVVIGLLRLRRSHQYPIVFNIDIGLHVVRPCCPEEVIEAALNRTIFYRS